MDDLQLIDLEQDRPGYRRFISSWLHRGDGLAYIVDTGPACSADRLLAELRRRDVTRLDWILLTHIHLDHAGAAGHVAAAFPGARVVCWPKAAPHLADPSRLWEGSLQVLGDTARLFGEPLPVDAGRIARPDALAETGIHWLHTPGHAPHHVSYLHGDVLFGGEAAGMTCPTRGGDLYMRPATPPRFFLDVALDSLARLQALEPAPTRFAFGHYGLSDDPAATLRHGARQLNLWVETLAELCAETGDDAWSPAFQERAVARLAERDPLFATLDDLEADLRSREEEYVKNTLEGMLGHLGRTRQA